ETSMQFVEMAGIGKWSLNESPFGKQTYEGKTGAELRKGGDIVDVYGRSGVKSFGGSFLLDDIDDTVYARIEGNAKVNVGLDTLNSDGTVKTPALVVSASENIVRIALAQAGGKTDDNSQAAYGGSGLVLIQTGDVQAGLVATAAGAPTITGPGTASIKA